MVIYGVKSKLVSSWSTLGNLILAQLNGRLDAEPTRTAQLQRISTCMSMKPNIRNNGSSQNPLAMDIANVPTISQLNVRAMNRAKYDYILKVLTDHSMDADKQSVPTKNN